ncbi:MAG: LemA family protein, partial [Candidatus Aenigmarchaeota archaeon]|nr:LemA family protein [Candidatus Aenigmarchaeota archaeon]
MALGMDIIFGVAILLAVAIIGGLFVIIYNNLVRLRRDIDKAWANIDVLLKQ